ncbi:hypothetical protein MGYG_03575 [Nannizzia gypsea CBS 118893]|uniref:Uncharacterized protein n=1 Tax=Arthroderma gypseum (strain ATCC MYA-4604 / CBS 118893) TaxID=535722 RepID=E4USQ6_ARTGP|nr:hypothetical protein MGYG_03575 [Nannizzia gypsea CBS 118893]EFR00571.1 hypothetical protein MGYG_03575 [Nannizzia gypsea CBS 118893]
MSPKYPEPARRNLEREGSQIGQSTRRGWYFKNILQIWIALDDGLKIKKESSSKAKPPVTSYPGIQERRIDLSSRFSLQDTQVYINSLRRVDRQTGQGVLADVAVTHSTDEDHSLAITRQRVFAWRKWQLSRVNDSLRIHIDALRMALCPSSRDIIMAPRQPQGIDTGFLLPSLHPASFVSVSLRKDVNVPSSFVDVSKGKKQE